MPASRLAWCTSDGGGLDAVHSAGLGVTGDHVGRNVEFCGDSLPVNRGTVGLGVGGLVAGTLEGLLAGQAGTVLEFFLDLVSLLGEFCDLGHQGTQGVDLYALLNVCEELGLCGGQGCIHFAVFH